MVTNNGTINFINNTNAAAVYFNGSNGGDALNNTFVNNGTINVSASAIISKAWACCSARKRPQAPTTIQ